MNTEDTSLSPGDEYDDADRLLNETSDYDQNERVILNVGGVKFEVSQSTLTNYPNTLLGSMFLPQNKHLRRPDKRGEYFFDR